MSEKKKLEVKPCNYSSLLSLDKEVSKKPKPVKKDNPVSKTSGTNNKNDKKRSRSTSPKRDAKNKTSNKPDARNKSSSKSDSKTGKKEKINWDIPDRTLGDLYCKPCDAHMNSEQMWEAHIQGKRHLKSTKKGETVEPKYEYIDEDPLMQPELDAVTQPIVGLQHICEIRRIEQQRPIYQCFLCSANLPNSNMLIDHMMAIKHRLAYLKEHDPERYKLIKNSDLKKGHLEPVVEECIDKHERDKGRGKMRVKQEIDTFPTTPAYKKAKKNQNEFPPIENFEEAERNWRQQKPPKHERGLRSYDRYDSPPRHPDDYWYERERDMPSRDMPPRDYPPRDYSSRDIDQRDYPSREIDPRDYPSRDIDPRDYPSYERESGDSHGRRPMYPDRLSPEPAYGRSSERLIDDPRGGDLREVLEKKKVLEYSRPEQVQVQMHAPLTSTSNLLTSSSSISAVSIPAPVVPTASSSSIPDNLLLLIEALNNVAFLQLALFKLERMDITEEIEAKMLDKIVNKATSLSLEYKTKMLPINLQGKFKESMLQNGIIQSDTFSNDFNNLMKMVSEYKQNTGPETTPKNIPQNVQPTQSQSVYSSYVPANTAGTYNSDMFLNKTLQQPPIQPAWQPKVTMPSSNNNLSSIPGLTLTNDTPSVPPPSPFDILARQAKDILGRVKSASNPYY